jgi:hypothetical protein
MTVGMSPPINDEVEHGVLAQLEAAGESATLCASCLLAALQVDRQRLMGSIRALMVRHRMIQASLNGCIRCGGTSLVIQRCPARSSCR